jgi:hypothetical protein
MIFKALISEFIPVPTTTQGLKSIFSGFLKASFGV